MIINVSIKDKRPTVEGSPVIVCGNSGYWVNFIFDNEWLELDPKTARFVYTQDGEVKYTDRVFSGNQVEIPILANIREVRVGVFAGELRTTAPAKIPCEGSIRCGTGAPQDPTPEQYDQIMQLLADSGVTSGLSMSDVVDSLASAETTKPLSANQGRVLNGKIAGTSANLEKIEEILNSHTARTSNPHAVTKAQVGLGNVPNVTTNDQTPTYSDTTTLATLSSGEKLNVALQKIKCAITNLINHINSHKLITYTSFDEIGVTYGAETIDDIATGMPSNSELLITIGADNADIYPQTYGVLHVLKKDITRVVFKFYSKTTAYEYLGVYDSTQATTWSGWVYSLGRKDVVDNLLSSSTDLPLSAKQGRLLDEKVSELGTNFSEAYGVHANVNIDNLHRGTYWINGYGTITGTLPYEGMHYLLICTNTPNSSSIMQAAFLMDKFDFKTRYYANGAWSSWQGGDTKDDNVPKTFTEMWEIGHSLYGGGLYIPLVTNCKNVSITSVQVFMASGWVDVRFSSYRPSLGKIIVVCDNPGDDTIGKSYLVRLTGSVS